MIRRRTLLAGGLLAPFVTACGGGDESPVEVQGGNASGGFHGTGLDDGKLLPDVELTDQHGKPFNLRTGWDTKVAALFFGYLNCPDVCPGIMADMATARRRLPDEVADDVTPILVTTDPARDDAEALRTYLERVDDRFVGLTGELDTIVAIGEQLGIAIEQGKQLPSGGYEVDHSTQVLGIGPDRRVRVVWTTLGLDVGNLREDYERLVRG
ncbi:SCO family protein [uncultured Tessaracoccus sp.]|uniref:SCO family protein n=1 Tax=uncultured Tessaracoccus sp. TaxID=905023 RepID=UPI0025EAE905|nr:SCO family protein [uncultured Tessaracoccus sp.]